MLYGRTRHKVNFRKVLAKKRSEVNPSYKKEMTVSKFGVDRPVHSGPNPRRFGFKNYVAILCVVFLFCGENIVKLFFNIFLLDSGNVSL